MAQEHLRNSNRLFLRAKNIPEREAEPRKSRAPKAAPASNARAAGAAKKKKPGDKLPAVEFRHSGSIC